VALNPTKGNMYPWVTHTWNPIKGCEHDCVYCYLKSLRGYDLTPRFAEKELNTNLGSGRTIFAGSTCDMFGEFIHERWVDSVMCKCREHDNTYLFQTKNPVKCYEYRNIFPQGSILGTTIETNRDYYKLSKAPDTEERFYAMTLIADFIPRRMVSIEPVIDFDLDVLGGWIFMIQPEFVSIGADSKGCNLPEPPPEKLKALIERLKTFTQVKVKDNLSRLL